MNDTARSRSKRIHSAAFSLVAAGATLFVCLMILLIVVNILVNGLPFLSWRLISGGMAGDMFDIQTAGLFPMIFGTAALVMLMTVFVMPVGVATAIYLHEYARPDSIRTRIIRTAINNLAGVPSIVFGLFGLGFFIYFIGGNLDRFLYDGRPVWGQPALLWASLTMAALTLPVVIVAAEEALRTVPHDLREASLALGATKLQTIGRVVLPRALPGILTGAILAVGRGAGEVAPIMFTGAVFFMPGLPKAFSEQFMHLGYHIFILSTQSPDIERTKPILYAAVMVLLLLTCLLNATAVLIRARIQQR
jgi:phosphate transport system permease protein